MAKGCPGRRFARRWVDGLPSTDVNLVDELHAVTGVLRDAGIRHAVCGGLAVTLHGATRMTKDIDLLVAASDIPLAGRPQDVADLERLEESDEG